ncbi:ComEC/Rec2 family competence protein [Ancylobacter terrae]|uniref:ComEC/Rec2 family competence protein n=1 Tax=Ancylobacter sp. sgz301288 TaxID=3342077 RepID=UPI00385ED792
MAGGRRLRERIAGLLAALARDVERELADRRAFLWLPVAFGAGIALYFSAAHEPSLTASIALCLAFAVATFRARARPLAFHLLAGLATLAGGFAVATAQVAAMAHPVLERQLVATEVAGFVEQAERRPRGARVVLRVTDLGRTDPASRPVRVRVSVTSGPLPRIGEHVRVRATLGPPPGPAYPGGYDFGRAAWFEGIGATGFALGRLQEAPAPGPVPWRLRIARLFEDLRADIGRRIRAVLSGDAAAVAEALVAGSRDAVSESVEESMRVSGLSHVLSISGLHMALVAMTLFVAVRALLAAVPGMALRYPVKAMAAVPALAGASFYLLLSGAEVPTLRSYVMTLIVLAGVLIGRSALTVRSLAVAALGVLALSPAAIFEPGTQMSFAATLALVAAYERLRPDGADGALPRGASPGGPTRSGGPGRLAPRRLAARLAQVPGGRLVAIIAASILTSLVAGLATAPYAAFHFQRMAPLGVVSNLVAMPLISLLVMPFGLLGTILIPFGFDGPAWRVMGWGIDGMLAVSDRVAAMPGADRSIAAFPMAALGLASLALIGVCLLRTRLIVLAPLCLAAALVVAGLAPRPAVLIDPQGQTIAVRQSDGSLSVVGSRADGAPANRFALEQWRAANGERSAPTAQGRAPSAPGADPAVRCDRTGCTVTGTPGVVGLPRSRDALADDCRLATILVTRFEPPRDCAARVIRTRDTAPNAAALFTAGEGYRLEWARPPGSERPWLPRATPPPEAPATPAVAASSVPSDPRATPEGFALPPPEGQ